jgi:hypothetical protein
MATFCPVQTTVTGQCVPNVYVTSSEFVQNLETPTVDCWQCPEKDGLLWSDCFTCTPPKTAAGICDATGVTGECATFEE